MMRLALNLASTRLILSHGNEGTAASGYVIQAFGKLIMQGNFVIGLIVFAILVIVNFVVITKGSGRIAEVAARFSLDAMPGKQMAIDADLSAGLIDEKEARSRRKELEAESNFFGAMDGASQIRARRRHCRPDDRRRSTSIGGIIIARGAEGHELRRRHPDLHAADRRRRPGVSQMPALIVSTAAGLMVSKAGVEGATDKALMGQLSFYPQALGMAAGRDGHRRGAARHADLGVRRACPAGARRAGLVRLQAQERAAADAGTPRKQSQGRRDRPRKSRSPPRWRSICCASSWAMACCR